MIVVTVVTVVIVVIAVSIMSLYTARKKREQSSVGNKNMAKQPPSYSFV